MQLFNEEVKMAVVLDKTSRVIAGFTDEKAFVSDGCQLLFEKKLGDIRFIPLEDGSVQATYAQEGVALPLGTMNSEQLIEHYDRLQQQQQQQASATAEPKIDDGLPVVDPLLHEEDVADNKKQSNGNDIFTFDPSKDGEKEESEVEVLPPEG